MAAAFHFRLEVVARLRKQRQDVQRRAVADAAQSVSAAEHLIAELERIRRGALHESREHKAQSVLGIDELRRRQLFDGWIRRRIGDTCVELARRRQTLDGDREKLAEATKECKVIEKLRHRQQRRHIQSVSREEQIETDEIGVNGYLRQRLSSGSSGVIA